jgi:hypothetical protein
MGKIHPLEAKAVAWAEKRIDTLNREAAKGDKAAKEQAATLQAEVDMAKRDLRFDGSGLMGRAVDSFGIIAHHPGYAGIGLGIAAAVTGAGFLAPGLLGEGAAAAAGAMRLAGAVLGTGAGAGFTWGASNLWEAKNDGKATDAVVQAYEAAQTPKGEKPASLMQKTPGDEPEINPSADAGSEWTGA